MVFVVIFPLLYNSWIDYNMLCILTLPLFCRATPIQSPPVSCSFRALLEEEENHWFRAGQVGVQRGRNSQGTSAAPAPSTRKVVTFKCEEGSEPERPAGCVSAPTLFCCFSTRWHCCTSLKKKNLLLPFKEVKYHINSFKFIFWFEKVKKSS